MLISLFCKNTIYKHQSEFIFKKIITVNFFKVLQMRHLIALYCLVQPAVHTINLNGICSFTCMLYLNNHQGIIFNKLPVAFFIIYG